MNKRSEQKIETRQKILQAAYEIFCKEGLLFSTTKDVAEQAKLSHGALFVHFPSKEELIRAVIDLFGEKFKASMEKHAPLNHELPLVLQAHLETIQEFENFYRELVKALPYLPLQIQGSFFLLQSGIAHYFQKSLKEIQSLYPKDLLFNSWLAILHYYLSHHALFSPDGQVIKTYGEIIKTFFISFYITGETHE